MGTLFDDISRIVASPLPRRRVAQLVARAIAGCALGDLVPLRAEAVGCIGVQCPAGQVCAVCPDLTDLCCAKPPVGQTAVCVQCDDKSQICCAQPAGQLTVCSTCKDAAKTKLCCLFGAACSVCANGQNICCSEGFGGGIGSESCSVCPDNSVICCDNGSLAACVVCPAVGGAKAFNACCPQFPRPTVCVACDDNKSVFCCQPGRVCSVCANGQKRCCPKNMLCAVCPDGSAKCCPQNKSKCRRDPASGNNICCA